MTTKKIKKKNSQDLTVRNLRAAKKRESSLEARVQKLESYVMELRILARGNPPF